jgi:hypothetical protein
MVTSIGQTAAGALSLIPGCTYDLAWSEGGGFEAQLGPFGFASARRVLTPPTASSSSPKNEACAPALACTSRPLASQPEP